jgi:hypothetical protein
MNPSDAPRDPKQVIAQITVASSMVGSKEAPPSCLTGIHDGD